MGVVWIQVEKAMEGLREAREGQAEAERRWAEELAQVPGQAGATGVGTGVGVGVGEEAGLGEVDGVVN